MKILRKVAQEPVLAMATVGLVGLALCGCTTPAQVCVGALKPMTEARLFFGDDIAGRAMVMASEWLAFVDQEVTPRFPDGFTVVTTAGQWRRPDGSIARESGHELIIVFESSDGAEERLNAIRLSYAARFMQQSVLLAEAPVCAGF